MKFSDNVIYLDNHILVVKKQAGLLTQSDGTAPSLEEETKQFIKDKFDKKGNVFLVPIHRLDKPVSGIVIFARTSKALSRLNEQMRAKSIKKTYFALVEGYLQKKEGVLEHDLIHGNYRAHVKSSPDSKRAKLLYKVLEEKENCTLLKIELFTGRYHQIRIQLSTIGHPILGDQKYGSHVKYRNREIALHHGETTFQHPIAKESLTFAVSPPFNLN